MRETWAQRLASKLAEQIDRAEAHSTDDSDDDQEATGAIMEFLADTQFTGSDRERLEIMKALYKLVAP